jgi:hypothetical protein
MAIDGNRWQSMAIDGNQWQSMAINGAIRDTQFALSSCAHH